VADLLKDLARAGQAERALQMALRLTHHSARVGALRAVAEGMSGIRPTFPYDPLQPQ
jgi:hypothetical protein